MGKITSKHHEMIEQNLRQSLAETAKEIEQNKDEALRMAIESLKRYGDTYGGTDGDFEALDACEKALEQPTQEPVALVLPNIHKDGSLDLESSSDVINIFLPPNTALYTHPKECQKCKELKVDEKLMNRIEELVENVDSYEWQDLTEEEIKSILETAKSKRGGVGVLVNFTDVARVVGQKLKEKNHG